MSGLTASGKSTLCAELARRTGLPLVAEGMAGLTDASSAYARLLADRMGPRDAVAEGRSRLLGEFTGWARSRAELRAQAAGFIADRWELDLCAWWLMSAMHGADSVTDELLRTLRAAAGELDYCVALPFSPPLGQAGQPNEDGLRRNLSFTARTAFHALLIGLMTDFVPLRVIRIPNGCGSPADRAEFVEQAILRDQTRRARSN